MDHLTDRTYRAALAAVGQVRRIEIGPISRRDVERFEMAVAGSITDEVIGLASPLFLSSVLGWSSGPTEGELLPDGNARDPFAGLDVAGLRLMAGGQSLTFHREPAAGATVTLEVSLCSADLKRTRGGNLLVLGVDRHYADTDGPLVDCRETFLGREARV